MTPERVMGWAIGSWLALVFVGWAVGGLRTRVSSLEKRVKELEGKRLK